MAGISISSLKNEKPPKKRERRAIPNLSSLSAEYSNPEKGKNNFESSPKVTQNYPKSDPKVAQSLKKSSPKVTQNYPKSDPKKEGKSSPKIESDPKVTQELAQNFKKSSPKVTQNYPKSDPKNSYSELIGQQRKVMDIMFYECYKKGVRVTPPLTIEFISIEAQIPSKKAIKRIIQELQKKSFISRKKIKNGRGGWTQYEIQEEIYSQVLHLKSDPKVTQNYPKSSPRTSPKVAQELAQNSSSSNNRFNSLLEDKKTITTHENKKSSEPPHESEWSTIQTPEILKRLGFGKSHIDQIKNKFQFKPEEVSKFLEAYSHDLENGELEKIKNRKISPIGYFFGALKNGGYNPKIEGFKTSEEIGQEETLARLEKRKKEREEKKQKLEGLLFEEWLETKTEEELTSIAKPPLGEFKGQFHLALLKDHFLKNEITEFNYG